MDASHSASARLPPSGSEPVATALKSKRMRHLPDPTTLVARRKDDDAMYQARYNAIREIVYELEDENNLIALKIAQTKARIQAREAEILAEQDRLRTQVGDQQHPSPFSQSHSYAQPQPLSHSLPLSHSAHSGQPYSNSAAGPSDPSHRPRSYTPPGSPPRHSLYPRAADVDLVHPGPRTPPREHGRADMGSAHSTTPKGTPRRDRFGHMSTTHRAHDGGDRREYGHGREKGYGEGAGPYTGTIEQGAFDRAAAVRSAQHEVGSSGAEGDRVAGRPEGHAVVRGGGGGDDADADADVRMAGENGAVDDDDDDDDDEEPDDY